MKQDTPQFHPMPGKIVVDLLVEDEIGGIIIPAQYARTRVMGTVRALGGDEEEGEFFDLAIGDTVLFGQNSGVEVTVDRVRVLILRTSEILCKVTWTN
jgi:Co-chaperonin GroES (HSP10)